MTFLTAFTIGIVGMSLDKSKRDFSRNTLLGGVILGVISNWDSRLTSTLENLELADHFKFILPSAVVGSAKPDKKIFEEALRLSGVKPHEACHIGDEIKTDIVGARNVGIYGILIDRDNRFDDFIQPRVKSFLELV